MARLQRESFDWWDPFDGGGFKPHEVRSAGGAPGNSGAPSRCPFCGGHASLRGGRAALAADDAPADTFILDLRCDSPGCGVGDFTVSASEPRAKPSIAAVPDPPDQLAA